MNKAKVTKSSRIWLNRQHNDPFVKQAKQSGYRARSAFKLLELQQKYNLLKPGFTVLDLGAAPGSWSQVASKLIIPDNAHTAGKLIAVDLLPIEPIKNVDIITGDFTDQTIFDQILRELDNKGNGMVAKVDIILSDVAPNLSGIWSVDLPRAMYLVEAVFTVAKQLLKLNGSLLVKVFQGEGFTEYLRMLRASFNKVISYKPRSSRAESREFYILGMGYKLL